MSTAVKVSVARPDASPSRLGTMSPWHNLEEEEEDEYMRRRDRKGNSQINCHTIYPKAWTKEKWQAVYAIKSDILQLVRT